MYGSHPAIAARDIRVQDTSGREAWAAIARTVLPSVLESPRVQGMSRPLGADSTIRGRYARRGLEEGSDTRGARNATRFGPSPHSDGVTVR